MPSRYRLDPDYGRFTVQAFAAGLLSALAHSPTFAVGRYEGVVRFGGDEVRNLELELTVDAASLALSDQVGASDRAEIEGRMRREVLEVSAFPEVRYRASCRSVEKVEPGRYRVKIAGPLSLHGVEVDHPIDAELLIAQDGVRLRGASSVRLSEHGIPPVTALAGAIKLKDELRVEFDVAGIEEDEP